MDGVSVQRCDAPAVPYPVDLFPQFFLDFVRICSLSVVRICQSIPIRIPECAYLLRSLNPIPLVLRHCFAHLVFRDPAAISEASHSFPFSNAGPQF